MKTFSVKNFDRFQHYKDRSPPWIKLYNELLDDYEFGLLPDASKMHLVAIWLLASRSDNKIPYDPKWVGRRINASDPVDLDILLKRGFILSDQELHISEHIASNALADCLPREEGQVQDIEKDIERVDRGARAPDAPKPEKKSRKKPRRQIDDGFKFSGRVRDYGARLNLTSAEIDREEHRFIRHAKQNARICADWDMAAENWLDKAAEFAGKPPPVDAAKAAEAAAALQAMFYARAESPQLDAWDAHYRAVSNKSAPRDRDGGWYFKTEWPPGHVPSEPSRHHIEPPRLKSMGDLH